MELIKKTTQLIMITGCTGTSGTTGCVGIYRIMIPDTGVTYNFKICLTQEINDIGFFDAYLVNNVVGTDGYWSGNTWVSLITNATYPVTGESTSRLSELRKYTTSTVFADQYTGGGNYNTDGVDYINSTNPTNNIIYYLGGIRYVDVLTGVTSGTTFNFTASGTSSPDFINVPYYKDPNKENIVSNPKINDDVFIIRQELSAFDKNYRLEFIRNLVDLETYASGKFFNIVNNT